MTDLWEHIWPGELEIYRSNPRAIPLGIGSFVRECANCGGYRVMMVFIVEGGPYKSPEGKVKWLDLPDAPDVPGRPTGSGWYKGKLEVAPCPVCQGGARQRWLESNCGLSGTDLDVSLMTFKTTPPADSKRPAFDVVQSLFGKGRHAAGFVTLHGNYGVGKTHLLKALTNGFRQMGIVARYARLADLLAEIRDRFGEERGPQSAEDAIETLRGAQVLCLDEVDRVNLTGWAKETVFRLLDARCAEQGSLLTVLATNLAPDRLPPEFGYLTSRMRGGVIVEVKGPDMRGAQGIRAREALLED
jgi:DNA replication protein DnaC